VAGAAAAAGAGGTVVRVGGVVVLTAGCGVIGAAGARGAAGGAGGGVTVIGEIGVVPGGAAWEGGCSVGCEGASVGGAEGAGAAGAGGETGAGVSDDGSVCAPARPGIELQNRRAELLRSSKRLLRLHIPDPPLAFLQTLRLSRSLSAAMARRREKFEIKRREAREQGRMQVVQSKTQT
jgi:hypothetical protein